jgi:hypothetical protein
MCDKGYKQKIRIKNIQKKPNKESERLSFQSEDREIKSAYGRMVGWCSEDIGVKEASMSTYFWLWLSFGVL